MAEAVCEKQCEWFPPPLWSAGPTGLLPLMGGVPWSSFGRPAGSTQKFLLALHRIVKGNLLAATALLRFAL